MKPMHESHARRRWPGFGAGFALLASLLPLRAAEPPPSRGPDEVLLVSNENSPVSLAVAADYARKRKVTHRLSVRCNDAAVDPDNETLSFADYRQLIERPLLAYLRQHDGIEFIVLTKGVPIRISGADTGSRDEHSPPATPLNSSVDSRLAALGYDDFPGTEKMPITGSGATGFGRLNRYWNSHEPFSHAKFGGYLVTRLDGYTEADAKALVARALAAEQALPAGKILFDVQPGFGLGDKAGAPMPIREQEIKSEWEWPVYNADMEKAHDLMAARRVPDEIDLDEAFVGHRSNLMGYFSWGSNDPKFSAEAYLSLTFAPGSIGDTAVSTSARTFLPTQGGQSLIADLVAHGITGVKGDTDEPLLQCNALPTILLDRYTSGWTLAESFYAASHFVSWQDIFIGDPLCAPYRGRAAAP